MTKILHQKSLNGIKSDGWRTCLKQKYLKKTQTISNQYAGDHDDDENKLAVSDSLEDTQAG